MPVSAVASSPADVSSLAAQASSSGGVTADLSNFTHAQSAGNKSGADAALVQLRSDLASEQTAMLSAMMGSADGGLNPSAVDTGTSLLSTVFSLGSNANITSALGSVQNLASQSASNAVPSTQGSINTYA